MQKVLVREWRGLMREFTGFLVVSTVFGLVMRWLRPSWPLKVVVALSLGVAAMTTALQLIFQRA
jgi:hypothetical protein